jgi:hypothetical protein
MQPYLSPAYLNERSTPQSRKVDKTGLIAWAANKYSVPLAYPGSRVGVCVEGDQLRISDLESGEPIACHRIHTGKGGLIKNTHPYRDLTERVQRLEQTIGEQVGDPERTAAIG